MTLSPDIVACRLITGKSPMSLCSICKMNVRLRDDLPFLAELAHFEWVELALSIAEAEPVVTEILSDAQLMEAVLVFTPVIGCYITFGRCNKSTRRINLMNRQR